MNRLLVVLGKLLGILLVAVGFLLGLVGLCGVIGITWESCHLGRLIENDRNAGLALVGLTVVGVLIFWAGVALLRKCGVVYTPAPPQQPVRSTPEETAAVLAALAKREQLAPASAIVTLLILIGSLAAFVAVGRLRWSDSYVAILVGVLLLHEGGHYFAMRAFGYRNVRMFFIPILGAVVSGSNPRAMGWQRALVALAGPLPGIAAGAGLALASPHLGQDAPLARKVASVLLTLNAFNLLPLLPFDGGRFLYETLFRRPALLRVTRISFAVLAGVAVQGLGLRLDSRPLIIFGATMFAGGLGTSRLDHAARALRSAGVPLLAPPTTPGQGESIRPEALPLLLDALKSNRQLASRKILVAEAVSVIDLLRAQPPRPAVAFQLLALYGATLALAMWFLLPTLAHRHHPFQRPVETTRQRPAHPADHSQTLVFSGG